MNGRTGTDHPGALRIRQNIALGAILLALSAQAPDAPLIERRGDMVCLNDAALKASERDRAATRLELNEARTQKAAVLVAVGVGGLVLGVVVGFVARPYLKH